MAISAELRKRAYVEKARLELGALEDAGMLLAGNAFASVLLTKGQVDAAERRDGRLLVGEDGVALRAALVALGYAPEDWCGLATVGANDAPHDGTLVRRAVCTLDPATLVACDGQAALAVREAFADEFSQLGDMQAALFSPGLVVRIAGMRLLNLGGFAAALADPREKQRMWAYLKQIPPLGEPY